MDQPFAHRLPLTVQFEFGSEMLLHQLGDLLLELSKRDPAL